MWFTTRCYRRAQAVSIGPDLFDVHTPDEHIDLFIYRKNMGLFSKHIGKYKINII